MKNETSTQIIWKDRFGKIIKAGDKIRNPYNAVVDQNVVENEKGELCFQYPDKPETLYPFKTSNKIDEYWEII